MEISGRIKKKKAVVVDSESLRALCDIMLKHCERLEFSAKTYAKTTITFENIDELLNYDNFKPRRIIWIEVGGYIGYYRKISVEIGELTFSPIVNYGSTVRCDYQLSSIDSEAVFKKDVEEWFLKAKSSYWLLGKFSFNGLLFVPSAFITFMRMMFGSQSELDVLNTPVLIALLIITIFIAGIVCFLKWLDAYLLGNLFPAVAFRWGEEIKRYEKWDKLRSNLLWTIIIGLLVGLVGAYLYDTLKGI